MANSFSAKRLRAIFTLATGTFGDGKSPSKIVDSPLRITADISKMSSPSKNTLRLRVYGMLQADMNALSTLGQHPLAARKNLVEVLAGDSDGLTPVFIGEITEGYAAYRTPPDLFFEVKAVSVYYSSLVPTQPTSMPGAVPAASLFQSYADKLGLRFNNFGVTNTISNPYFTGSAFEQAQQLANAMEIEFGVDDGTLFIAPLGKARSPQGQVPVISPSTGMVEYPTWSKEGVEVKSIFNPGFQLNGQVVIQDSVIAPANGVWRVHGLTHALAANDPKSKNWFSHLKLVKEGV